LLNGKIDNCQSEEHITVAKVYVSNFNKTVVKITDETDLVKAYKCYITSATIPIKFTNITIVNVDITKVIFTFKISLFFVSDGDNL
jgi:hypothetical protein